MTMSPASPDSAALRAQTADLGEYFALSAPGEGEWRAWSTFYDAANLVGLVDRTRHAIAASANCDTARIPVRLAASSLQLGVTARLLSPVVGAATCFGVVPLLTSTSVLWQVSADHPPRLGTAALEWVSAPTTSRAATLISESILATIIRPLNDALRSAVSLPSHVAWGNVTSAANGAVTVLSMSRPQDERRGRALVRSLMAAPPLAGTGSFTNGTFVRRSCCLFYLAPHGGFCGDCVLA
jgi:hypothetical protein